MDVSTLLEHAVTALTGGGVTVASLVRAARRFVKRVDKLEEHFEKDGTLAKMVVQIGVELDKRDKDLDDRIKRMLNTMLTRSSRADVDVARATAQAVSAEAARAAMRPLEEALRNMQTELRQLKDVAEGAMQASEFVDHVASDSDRWRDVHHTLGTIEGTLGMVRDRLKERG